VALPTLEECRQFVAYVQPDLFAPAVGTAHGEYATAPEIDWRLVDGVAECLDVPLVLHGGTGLPADVIKRFDNGRFRKMNFATSIRLAFTDGIRTVLDGGPRHVRPQRYLEVGRSSVADEVEQVFSIIGGNLGR
jgi:tagatose 1,6-diphosphate aldolase GatY/KbaY